MTLSPSELVVFKLKTKEIIFKLKAIDIKIDAEEDNEISADDLYKEKPD